jgi:competence protein ComEA
MTSNTTSYTIHTPLRRNGALHEPGENIELARKEAAPLLAVGAIAERAAEAESTREEGSAVDPAAGTETSPGAGEAEQGAAKGVGDDPAAGSAAAGESSGNATGPVLVNVNTASAAEIAKAAKGIGKKTAADIVAHREQAGNFASLDDLVQVGGISQAIVDQNREVLTA